MTDSRFKPGQSGNPGGRPKRTRELQALLREAFDKQFIRADGSDELVELMCNLARSGDTMCIKLIAEYRYAKPIEPHEHSAEDGQQVGIRVEFVKAPEEKK